MVVFSMKKIAGSIMVGFGVLTKVISEWSRHFFYAVFNIAKGTMLQGGGSFTVPSMYSDPTLVTVSTITNILIWLTIIFGLGLIVIDLKHKK
jgi:hypothetical protein